MIDKNIISLDIEYNQPSNSIIQIGLIIGNLKTGKILKEYEEYVFVDEKISEEITKLTGINQLEIDNLGQDLQTIYEEIKQLHKEYNCFRNPLTWGGGDSESLRNKLNLDNEIFIFGRRWIDVKTLFISYRWSKGRNAQAGLAKALTKLDMQFKGKKHTAKDDALNTFLIYRELLNKIKDIHFA